MRSHDYWVYILTNKHCTTLYIGITSNVARRLYQHRYGEVKGFTKRYHLNRLVWIEHFRNVKDAIACEKKLKGWRRSRKVALIEQTNPRWLDLSDDWNSSQSYMTVHGRWKKCYEILLLRYSRGVDRSKIDPRFFAPLRMTS
jgi:putative endonuclease